MKQLRYSFLLIMAAVMAACTKDPLPRPAGPESDGVTLRGTATVPGMAEVSTRALDGDGLGIKSLQCFCFDASGLMVCRVTAKITADNGATGEFEARIPNSVRTVHFIANGNFDFFRDAENIGRHESAVISQLESTSGLMVYWGRISEPDGFAEYGNGAGKLEVPLIRNQARVSVEGNDRFIVTGYAICNKYAWGTVAPFNRTGQRFDWELPSAGNAGNLYVTLPPDVEKATDDAQTWDIEQNPYRYIFENPNDEADQTYLIVKGHQAGEGVEDDLYYKVLLLDKDKNPHSVYRNHHYRLKITGGVSLPGAATFEEAKGATPLNNVLLAVGPEIYSISDGTQTFSLDQKNTTYLYTLQEGQTAIGERTITYTYQTKDPQAAPLSRPEATLISNSNAIQSGRIYHDFVVSDDGLTGKGTIRFNVSAPTADRTGRAAIYIKAGKFTRTLNILVIDKFHFGKPWITSGIYNRETGVPVGFTFTIPEDYPAELLPLECKISVNEITGNVSMGFGEEENSSQKPLRVITPDSYEGDWGEETGFSYKYLYEATTVGQHRIYFTTRQTDSDLAAGNDASFFFETPNFVTVEKTIRTASLNSTIEFDGVFAYSENADVKYMLVPQIANSPVDIQFHLTLNGQILQLTGDQTVPVRIYTENLQSGDLELHRDTQEANGSYYLFTATADNHTGGVYTVPFTTRRADCAEAIRLADDRAANDDESIAQYAFRSKMMELGNYRMFDFSDVEIYGYEHDVAGRPVTGTSTAAISYIPGSEVFVNFTAKPFTSLPQPAPDGSGGTVENTVTPKYPVRCLIAAGNLEPADGQSGLQLARDASGTKIGYYYDVPDASPVRLRFKTDKIVSAGDVVISSVGDNLFEPYLRTLTNQPIRGMLYYAGSRDAADADKKPVPAGSFVTLERQDGTRIGQIVVREPVDDPVYGPYNYTLTLRGEYRYGWDDTKVTFKFSQPNSSGVYGATTYLSIIQTEPGGTLGLDPDSWDQTGN